MTVTWSELSEDQREDIALEIMFGGIDAYSRATITAPTGEVTVWEDSDDEELQARLAAEGLDVPFDTEPVEEEDGTLHIDVEHNGCALRLEQVYAV